MFFTLLKFRYRADLLFWHFYLCRILFRARHRCENTFYYILQDFLLNKMGFGDLKKKEGLSVLNAYLADKSYIEGLVYFYSFFSFRIKHFWKKGGMGLHCIPHLPFPSKSSTISDTYATHWKFSCPRLVTVLIYFDMWYKGWGNIWQMV